MDPNVTIQTGPEQDGVPFVTPEVEQEPTRVPFIADDAQTPVTGDTARYRAMKMHIALGDASPGIDSLENSIVSGREKALRQSIALSLSNEQRQKIQDHIQTLTQTNVVTPEIARNVTQMLQNPPQIDPEIAPEEGFADKFTKQTLNLLAQRNATIANKAMEEDTKGALDSIKGTNFLLARREIARSNFEDTKATYEKQGWGRWTWNVAKGFVPGVSGAELSPDWNPANIALPGLSMQDEIQKYWSFKSNSEAAAWLKMRTSEISKSNVNTGLQYAASIMNFTHDDSSFMNAMGLLDTQGIGAAVSVLGIKAAAVTTKSGVVLQKALRDSVKAVDPVTGAVTPISQAAAVGDVRTASQLKTAKDFLRQADPLFQASELENQLHNLMRTDYIVGPNTPAIVADRAKGLLPLLNASAAKITKAITAGVRAERLPEELISVMKKETEELWRLENPSIASSVLDDRVIWEPLNNTRHVEFILGTRDRRLFASAEEAEKYAQREYGLPHTRVVIRNEPSEAARAEASLSAAKVQPAAAAEPKVKQTAVKPTEVTPEFEATGFKTSMGSTYEVHADGTTTRNKAFRPEHGQDFGPKPQSSKTVYLTEQQANALAPPMSSSRIVDHEDGTLSLATRAAVNQKWGISPSAKNIPYATEPAKGLIPLELWRKPDSPDKKIISQWINGKPVYGEMHFGNKIVEVSKPSIDEFRAQIDAFKAQAQKVFGEDVKKPWETPQLTEIKQEGNSWYISVTKPFNETTPGIRSQLITISTTNTNPVNLANTFLGSIARSAEDQLAYFQRGARHLVTSIPQEIQRVMKEFAKEIGHIRGKDWTDLELVLNRNKDFTTIVDGKPVRGMAFRNQQQLEKAWWDATEKVPTVQQSLAYWRYHQLMAADWMMRNLGVSRDLVRQGVEHFTLDVGDKSVFLPGRFEKEIPWENAANFGIAINWNGEMKHYWKNSMPQIVRDTVKGLHEMGELKVVQVANPADRPLRDFTGNTVNFILTKEYDSKPLPMNLVDWNPGVHVIYPHPYFVKQPIMQVGEKGLLRYYGDKVIFAVDSQQEAAALSKDINVVQKMFRDKASDTSIQDYIARNLPGDFDFWKNKFTGDNAFLSLEHPIGPVYTGKSFFETNPGLKPSGLTDERHSEFNLFGAINMDFLANRDGPLQTVTRGGTAEAPVYSVDKARTLDPFKSLSRGLVTAVDGMVVNDAKYAAVEQWTAQYAHLFNNPDAARANPFQAFYGFVPNKSLVPRDELASAINTRERIIQFLGSSTEFGKDMNWLQQKMINSFGQEGARWYNDHELRFLKDPIAFTKSWMFNFRFGFLNPAQFIVQGMGFAHVLAVAGPQAAWRGITGYVLSRALGMTDEPAVINRLANIAAKMGWGSADTFKEAYTSMRAIGWDIIGREHSVNAQTFDPNIFKNGFNTALEWGRVPFTEGERLTRETAWYTAFHEWRVANPGKETNNFELAKILTRADDLSSNMTKASHSRLQEGIFAVPTQFYTFSHRMLEQFWGGRLTWQEKLRAGLTHSALFGLPVTAAIGIPWPINDSLKQHLMEEGSPLLDNGWYKAATEGFLSWSTHMVTGTEYNVENRYGPGFSDYFKKLIGGELSAVEAIGGASGSFLKSLAKSLYPFYAHVTIAMKGGQEEFPLAKEDIFEVLREISSVNNFHNAWYAINTGKYLSRDATFVQDGMSVTDAAMMVLSLTRKDITDLRLQLGSLKDQKDAQQKIGILAEREFKRAYTYMGDNDWDKADAHLARAKALMVAIGDFKEDMIHETLKRATAEGTPLVERIKKDFTEKGNRSQLPARLQRLFDGMKK